MADTRTQILIAIVTVSVVGTTRPFIIGAAMGTGCYRFFISTKGTDTVGVECVGVSGTVQAFVCIAVGTGGVLPVVRFIVLIVLVVPGTGCTGAVVNTARPIQIGNGMTGNVDDLHSPVIPVGALHGFQSTAVLDIDIQISAFGHGESSIGHIRAAFLGIDHQFFQITAVLERIGANLKYKTSQLYID